MLETALIAEKMVITEKGDSAPIALTDAANRVFLLTLDIQEVVEQESFELMVFGSADGQTWIPKPVLSFPQKFYRGEYPMLLDLSSLPDIKFLRAYWEVNRWGRGSEAPMFVVGVKVKEVPAALLQASGKK